jgi:predicted lipase
VAHNDEIVVVSFRCTTSAMDWMTNFAATSSEWELDEDLEQGHSGFCSCLDGRFFGGGKPRVHTGFYNNILQTIPLLEEFVDPLLAANQPPRKLYVVGHSLGAGMSTLATLYFLHKHAWKDLPHKLINVSAGTPKSLKPEMAEKVEGMLAELRPLDKAVVCRVVMNEDMVTKVPFGYVHVGKLVFLTEDGHVLVGPQCDDAHVIDEGEMKALARGNPALQVLADAASEEEEDGGEALTAYEAKMRKIPRPFRDHCPDYYLAPLVKLIDREYE